MIDAARAGAREAKKGYALVAAAAVLWGTWPLFLRRAEHYAPIPAAVESLLVMIVVTIASAPPMITDRVRVRARLVEWLGVGWLGVGDALNVVLFFAAYRTTSVAVAVLTHYLTPLFVALAAPFALREPWRARTLVAAGASFAGLVLLLGPWRAHTGSNDSLGALLGAGSAVFYATNVLVTKRLTHAFSGSEMMFFHGFVAVPLLFFVALFSSGAGLGGLDPRSALVLICGGLVPGALAGLLFQWGLRRIPASHASILALLEPVVAVGIGVAIFGESIGVLAVLGGALVLGSAATVVAKVRESK